MKAFNCRDRVWLQIVQRFRLVLIDSVKGVARTVGIERGFFEERNSRDIKVWVEGAIFRDGVPNWVRGRSEEGRNEGERRRIWVYFGIERVGIGESRRENGERESDLGGGKGRDLIERYSTVDKRRSGSIHLLRTEGVARA